LLRYPEHLRGRHVTHLQAADVVTAVSAALIDEARSFGADPLLLSNGVEYEHFAAHQPTPAVLENDRVVIGFAGGVTRRLNFELLTAVADAEPNWLVVLVGPVTTQLPQRPNLLACGEASYALLPAWMQRFNVGTIPYWVNEYNVASSPMKTFEYLAAGRPVVAVPLPMLRGLEPHVQLAADADEFLAATRQAVAFPPSADSCRRLASLNSWDSRARALERRIAVALA
jgi:glycosyltransferase involved in cell wall biosynthesis